MRSSIHSGLSRQFAIFATFLLLGTPMLEHSASKTVAKGLNAYTFVVPPCSFVYGTVRLKPRFGASAPGAFSLSPNRTTPLVLRAVCCTGVLPVKAPL